MLNVFASICLLGKSAVDLLVNCLNPIQRDPSIEYELIIELLQTGTESRIDETESGQQGCWQTKKLTDETHERFSKSGQTTDSFG